MRFAFDEDQHEMRDAVADALAEACPPGRVREAWEARDAGIREVLGDLGLLGLNLPESAGGLGLGPVGWILPLEETGRYAVPTPLVETIATNPTLVEAGWTELAERVAEGASFVALAEVGPDGVSRALDADVAWGVLRAHEGRVERCVEPSLTPCESVDGSRRVFALDGAWEAVDADAVGLTQRASLAAAAQLLGLSRHLLDVTVEYAKARRQFGKAIGSFQAVQHHLVDALLKQRFAGPAVYRAAWCLENGTEDADVAVRMAKLYASEAAELTVRKALQVHGAIGYTFEYDLHLWMKRVWALSAAWGAPHDHLDAVAAHLLPASPGAPHG